MDLPALRTVITSWAATEPLIRRVYLFGSRAKGINRPDSDVDLALLFPVDEETWAAPKGTLIAIDIFTRSELIAPWQAELQALFPYRVDLHHARRWQTERIWPALKESRICLYRRGEPATMGGPP